MVSINEIVEIVEIREHDEQVILKFAGIVFIETNDFNKLDNKPAIPASLSDLASDATHRT
jgi:hypothetical protein